MNKRIAKKIVNSGRPLRHSEEQRAKAFNIRWKYMTWVLPDDYMKTVKSE